MGFVVVCESCEKQLSIPAGLYERKVRGRVVTIACKRCGAPIRIDATVPPPGVEAWGASDAARAVSGPEIPRAPRLPGAGEPAASSSALDDAWDELEPPVRPAAASSGLAAAGPGGMAAAAVARSEPVALADVLLAPDEERSGAVVRSDVGFPSAAPQIAEPGARFDASEPPGAGEDDEHFAHADGPISVRAPIATIGRYTLFDKFATGGMATVHFGRLDGAGGFSRVVAIKRLLPNLVRNAEFVEMLLNEARLAARVRHPNVVAALDVVASKGDVLLVLEYVHGEALGALCRSQAKTGRRIPIEVAAGVMLGALEGLHSVHEAMDERGRPLGLVHRDFSPPNVIVGVDGVARVLDFGIVKALERIEETVPNRLKGKTGYMSPEQIRGERITRGSDIFAAGIVLWELLTLRRFASGKTDRDRMEKIMQGGYPRPSEFRPEVGPELDEVTMRALEFQPEARFATAREFGQALESAASAASAGTVARWVDSLAQSALAERARRLAQVENWRSAHSRLELSSTPFAADLGALGLGRAAPPPLPGGERPADRDASNGGERDAVSIFVAKHTAPLLISVVCLLLVLVYLLLR